MMTCEQPYCERPLDHDGPCGFTQDDDRSRRSIIEERDALRAEANRLRGLILGAESTDGHCPWCDSHGVDLAACGHFPDCSAFSARGEVRHA